MAPRNFIVTYSARVGSSALVDTLSRTDGVIVPIFEELDWFHIEREGLQDRQNESNIHEVVDWLFAEKAREHPGCSIGFKWRIFGRPEALAPVFARRDVVLFNMVRADLFELASSKYLTHVVYGDNDAPQFQFRDTESQERREDILTRYRLRTVDADIGRFRALCQEYVQGEMARIGMLREIQRLGITVYNLVYEDFAYKRLHFLNRLLDCLGHAPLETFPVTALTKVSSPFPSELFRNRGDLLRAKDLFALAAAWDRTVFHDSFPVLCA